YQAAGRAGLINRPPIARYCPHRTPAEIEQRLVAAHRAHPCGAKQLHARVRRRDSTTAWPHRSTVAAILARHGLTTRRARPPAGPRPVRQKYAATRAGELMTADFKGQFRLRNRQYCYPLTLMDRVSRYLQACEGLTSTTFEPVWAVMVRVFREWGLPDAVQT